MNALGMTDVGLRRHENQDTFAIETVGNRIVAVVCDGMGGAEGGQIASSLAVETFMKNIRALLRKDMTMEQLRELASFCVAQANTAVYQRSLEGEDCRGMGTTLVSAVAGENGTIVCNVGDSRAYLLRNGGISRITHDHSVVQTLVESGNITAEEARTHPNRNLITARSERRRSRSATHSRSHSRTAISCCCAATGSSLRRRTKISAVRYARERAQSRTWRVSSRLPKRRAHRTM